MTFTRFETQRKALTTTLRQHGISASDTKSTHYQKQLRTLERQVNSDAPPPDLATQLSRTMLALNLGLISTAEDQYRENSTDRNLYALIALVELCRGLSTDLKNQSDLNSLLDRVLREVLEPALANIAAQAAAQYNSLKRSITSNVSGKMADQLVSELLHSGREFASLLQETQEQVGVKLRSQLTGGK